MKTNFRFAGGREMAKFLTDLPARTSVTIQRQALRAAAEPMRDDMARLAPHEPGAPDLKESMTVSNVRSGTDEIYASEVAVAVGPAKNRYYGVFQEFGTVHHGAQPFARPAFDLNVTKSLSILASFMWAAIAKRRGPVTGIRTSERTL
jgi:HK97 gp10 family phage protein